MRQGLLVVLFVSYSLLAFAQGPGGGPMMSDQEALDLAKSSRNITLLTTQQISDLDKIAGELGYFPTGTTNHTVPAVEQFQIDYRAKYKSRADVNLLKNYIAYREHRSKPVGATITMHRVSDRDQRRGEFIRLAMNGNLAFMMAMAEKNGGDVTLKMDEDCAGQTQLNRCPLTPPGYTDLSDKRGPGDLMRSQADCFERIATEINDANPLCARAMRISIERYRFLVNFKYPIAADVLRLRKDPFAGEGATQRRVAPKRNGGQP